MKSDFDLAVIGGGSAGLTAAGIGANLGAKVALIERDRLGGDCTWTGCVPSKTLLHAARVAEVVRTAHRFGIEVESLRVDFEQVMRRLRETRQSIYEDADAPHVWKKMGVDVKLGAARFVDDRTLKIEGREIDERLTARSIIIAAGSAPLIPPIDGLSGVPFLTNESIFELQERPEHLLVIGAGPVGVEMAQAFRRLGSKVTVLDSYDRILRNDDPEASAVLLECLQEEGIQFILGGAVERVNQTGDQIDLHLAGGSTVTGDSLLVATGRRPNINGLDLDQAGVEYSRHGIETDKYGRTSAPHIFAAGDVIGGPAFTHTAEHTGKIAAMNALYKLRFTFDFEHLPWVTYTTPEVAHAGATKQQLEADGTRFETYRFPYENLDRALTDGASVGFISIHAKPWSGKILGASVVGERAGELISEIAVALRNGLSLRQLSDTIHPYPSYGLGVRRAADQWYVRRRSARMVKLLQGIFRHRGPILEYGPDDVL